MHSFKHSLGPFVGGLLFAIGLGVSGMTEAAKIVAFLDVFGGWQADLLFVMGGALVVFGVAFHALEKRSTPLFADKFHLPQNRQIDRRLIGGGVLFGLGWGITGLCPGPGLVALVSGQPHAIVFVVTMLLGICLGRSSFGTRFLAGKN